MRNFIINGIVWEIEFVNPGSEALRRSDGSTTYGSCYAADRKIYLSDALRGEALERVLCHEITHAVCMAWGISIPLETEEWLCNFMVEHGKEVIYLLDGLMGIVLRRAA